MLFEENKIYVALVQNAMAMSQTAHFVIKNDNRTLWILMPDEAFKWLERSLSIKLLEIQEMPNVNVLYFEQSR